MEESGPVSGFRLRKPETGPDPVKPPVESVPRLVFWQKYNAMSGNLIVCARFQRRDSRSEPGGAFSAFLCFKIQSLEHGLAEMKETQVGKLFLDVFAGWFFEAQLDLVDERSRPFVPGAEEELAAGPGRERAAQSGSEFLRHLGGSVFGVCYPEPEDGVVGLARPLLEVHESVPGPIQQIIAPGINDPCVQILQSRSADDGHLHVGVQPAGLTLAPMVIDHQVPD